MIKDVTRSFLENVDYLRQLCKEIEKKDISTYDSNLIYEVAYADTLINDLIIKNSDLELSKELTQIKGVFDFILSSLPKDEVLNSREKCDYKSILKIRYNDLEDASFDKKYKVHKNLLSYYFGNRLPTITVMGVVFYLLISGNITKLSSKLIGTFSGVLDSSSNVSETANNIFSGLLGSLVGLIAFLLVCIFSIKIFIDMIYMSFPMLQDFIGKFVSSEVKDYVKDYAKDNKLVKYQTVKSFDRVERNLSWLDSMLGTLREGFISNDRLLQSLESVEYELKNKNSTANKYKLYAKIEFLHDEYLDFIQNTEPWRL